MDFISTMIYTVTLNPAIDYIVRLRELRIGTVNRMREDLKLPGGKGINVSRILQRLNTPNTALGFIGGFTGHFIAETLHAEKIHTDFTKIQHDTRINIKIKDVTTETEINGAGPEVSAVEMGNLKLRLSSLEEHDIVIFSGSKPPSVPENYFQELIALVKQQGANFVIDTTGKDLLDSLNCQPLVVKPNHHELAELFNASLDSLDDIVLYGKKLLEQGAHYAMVSMAGDGALLFTPHGTYQSNALKRQLKNSVGAGDSMIAGFVGSYQATEDPIAAFKTAVACGSATAFSDDLATTDFIQELLPEVKISQIK
ncbi:MAG: 1-phosphofructokinase [Micrococcaceae bacterium]